MPPMINFGEATDCFGMEKLHDLQLTCLCQKKFVDTPVSDMGHREGFTRRVPCDASIDLRMKERVIVDD